MAAGWIYVLVNSAMPGLVKVGKTTRDPLQRANELSGVTSVATPFVLAFQEYFADCDAAEMLVHRQLTRDGHREADNREFFRASPSDVIKTILAIAENVGGLDVPSSLAMGAAGGISPNSPPWMTIESEADAYYFGLGNCLQDYDEARKLYLDAMRLGSSVACERVGDIYHYGEGTPQDDKEALRFYKEGARRGNFFCHASMAVVYASDGQDENASKCWQSFFNQRDEVGASGFAGWESRYSRPAKGRWYVLNTYVGNEHTLKANIERRIQSMNMRDKIFRVVVPMEPDLEFKDGRLATPVFPGYVLIEMNWSDQSWELVRSTPGVTGFVGAPDSGSKPVPLTDKEAKLIVDRL